MGVAAYTKQGVIKAANNRIVLGLRQFGWQFIL